MKQFTEPTHKYEPHILKLQTVEGFYELWITRIPYTRTHEQAYESAEGFFEACYGKRKYSDYKVFRSSVSQWLKRRNANKN